MTVDEIPVFKPAIGPDTLAAVEEAFRVGWLGMGSFTKEFEEKLAAYLGGGRYAVAANTGTSALHMALRLAGAGPGDEVITTSFNFVADLQAITATGAALVLCDIREDNFGIDAAKARALVSKNTKAILPLHFSGIACDLDGVYALAKEKHLRVVEDSTHAFGSLYGGRKIGSFGDLACFSFDPVKIVTSIDGGAVVGSDPEDVQTLHQLRLLGIDRDTAERYKNRRAWEYDVLSEGYRYHLTNINAAIGLSQLRRVDDFIRSRRETCRTYQRRLADLSWLRVPGVDYADVSPFIFFVRVEAGRRDAFMEHLRSKGVAAGIHFSPCHRYDFYAGARRGDMMVTDRVGQEIVTLPLHSNMAREAIDRVCDAVRSFR